MPNGYLQKTRLLRIKLIHMARRGLTAQQIAERLKLDHHAVRARLRYMGIELKHDPHRGRPARPFGDGDLSEEDARHDLSEFAQEGDDE